MPVRLFSSSSSSSDGLVLCGDWRGETERAGEMRKGSDADWAGGNKDFGRIHTYSEASTGTSHSSRAKRRPTRSRDGMDMDTRCLLCERKSHPDGRHTILVLCH
jgi:hypothetical protein